MRTFLLGGLICGLFYLAAESTVCGAQYMRPGGPYASDPCACGSECSCDQGCGPACGPTPCYLRRQNDCGGDCGFPCRWPGGNGRRCDTSCDTGCDPGCDPCCKPCRPMTCHDRTYCGPLTPIFALFTRDSWCGNSCGERYWGDFYSDPPDWCEPCDRCGNYTGGYSGWSGNSGRGCNCGGSGGSPRATGQMVPMEGNIISQGDKVMNQVPTPAPKPKKTVNP